MSVYREEMCDECAQESGPRTAEQIMAIGRDLLEAGWQEALRDVLHDHTGAEVFLTSRMAGWVEMVKQFHRGGNHYGG